MFGIKQLLKVVLIQELKFPMLMNKLFQWELNLQSNKYMPYYKWKELENKDAYFTLSNQDIIILEEIKEKEITPNNIVSIRNKYSPNACEIRNIEEVENKLDTRYQFRVNGI